ncbi:MAG: Asp-tRNA(Asn)/Glu-tRNA(Gln) amidotransferase subunit GatC [Myxococcota bacterium]
MKMNIDHVANLARIRLRPEEAETYGAQLGRVLEYVDLLGELDTSDVEPTSHPLAMDTAWREDEAGEPLPRERALANAPDDDGEHFVVPKVV